MTEEQRQRAIQGKLARMQPGAAGDSIPTDFGPLTRGTIVELFGPSASGKTSIALSLVAQWQNAGGAAAWVDADHTFDPAYAALLGVFIERMPVVQPDSAEQAFAMLAQLALSGAVELLVVDSAAALAPAIELETGLGQSGPGLQNRVVASGLRRMIPVLARSRASVLFLNQTRMRSGDEEGSAAGNALKLHAGLRIALEPVGLRCARFRIVKNKAGVPFREGDLWWNPAGETTRDR
jgi:recombination protein RecA